MIGFFCFFLNTTCVCHPHYHYYHQQTLMDQNTQSAMYGKIRVFFNVRTFYYECHLIIITDGNGNIHIKTASMDSIHFLHVYFIESRKKTLKYF